MIKLIFTPRFLNIIAAILGGLLGLALAHLHGQSLDLKGYSQAGGAVTLAPRIQIAMSPSNPNDPPDQWSYDTFTLTDEAGNRFKFSRDMSIQLVEIKEHWKVERLLMASLVIALDKLQQDQKREQTLHEAEMRVLNLYLDKIGAKK